MRPQTLTFGVPHTYSLEKLLNETDYSKVYQAYDDTAERPVCIKQINVQVFASTVSDPLKKIQEEIRAMTTIGNDTPHIPCLLDHFYDPNTGILSIVMQLCNGVDLREKMTPQTPSGTFLQYMIDLCDALAVMHSHHIYHKDIKPANIRIAKDNTLILLDFNTSLSAPNLYEGTPGYRAPEMETKDMTANRSKADIFAVGLLLYQFYAQVLPMNGMHYYADGQAWGAFVPPSKSKNALPMPYGLEPVIMKCLSFQPDDRYDAISLKRKLQQIREGEIEWKLKKRIQKNMPKP